MIVQVSAVVGQGHRVYNDRGQVLGVAERVLVHDAVVLDRGLLSDLGVFETAVKGAVVAVWGVALSDKAANEDVLQLLQYAWPVSLPRVRAVEVDGQVYTNYRDRVRTIDRVLLQMGEIYCDGASGVPQQ